MDRNRNLTRDLDLSEQNRFYVGKDGGFGEVFGSFLSYGRPVVIKRIKDANAIYGRTLEEKRITVNREAGIWERLSHRNVLPLYGYAMFKDLGPLRLFISPYVPGGDLASYVDRHDSIQPTERERLMTEVAFGIEYLHTFDPPISHGDMKPNNILVSHHYDPVIKTVETRPLICDFGLARIVTEDKLQTTSLAQGAPVYRAWEFQFISDFRKMYPDQLIHNDEASMLTGLLKGDIWGWAMTALRVFLGREPFPSDLNYQLIERCRQGVSNPCDFNVALCKRNGMTDKFLSAMKQSWRWDPKGRPDIGSLITLLGVRELGLSRERPMNVPPLYPPATGYVANGRPIHFFVRAKRRSHADPKSFPPSKDRMRLDTRYIVAVREVSSNGWWRGKGVFIKTSSGLVKPANVRVLGEVPTDLSAYFCVVARRDQSTPEKDMLLYQCNAQLFVRSHGNMYMGFEPIYMGNIQGRFPCNYVDTHSVRHLKIGNSRVLFCAEVKEAFRDKIGGSLDPESQTELHFEENDLIGVTKAPDNARWAGVRMDNDTFEGTFSRDAVSYL